MRTSLFFSVLSRWLTPDSSSLSTAGIGLGASAGICFWIGLVTTRCTGPALPVPPSWLIELMCHALRVWPALPALKNALRDRRCHENLATPSPELPAVWLGW